MAPTTNKIRKFKHTFTPTSSPSFPYSSSNHYNSNNNSTTLSNEPELQIQSTLLHLGMRIRKSVSQGYRTAWAAEEEKFHRITAASVRPSTRGERLERITLWEDTIASAPAPASADAEEGFIDESFPSSQDSVSSTQSGYSISSIKDTVSGMYPGGNGSRKRAAREADDEEEAAQQDEADQMDASSTCLRPIAQATSRKRSYGLWGDDRLRREKVLDDVVVMDFDEAGFLDESNWL